VTSKHTLEPHEWYSYKREYPKRYRILKQFILEYHNWKTSQHEQLNFVTVLHFRKFFCCAVMITFLLRYRHQMRYAHLRFEERKRNNELFVRIEIEQKHVPLGSECDYLWEEVKAVLEKLVLSSETEQE
jgi:hypothetical protein